MNSLHPVAKVVVMLYPCNRNSVHITTTVYY